MSQLVWIGSSEHIDFIRNKLELESKLLLAEGVVLKINEQKHGGYTFFGISVPTDLKGIPLGEGTIFSLRYSVAKILTELITLKFERQLLQNLIKVHYHYFTWDERLLILEKALGFLAESYPQRRKHAVLQLIFDYLETERLLNLEGFIRFRLGSYMEELSDAVEQAVDEYLAEKEYNDFIRLLRYFVEIQEPRIERVNVLIQPSGLFQLYDSCDNIIKSDYLESFVAELAEHELSYEDLLISTLITLAPRHIILHLPDPGGVMSTVHTIESVFAERVSLCRGCAKCANYRKHNKKP
ncbi:MAG TPA: putative sporulation protein YtxC [Clostridia bacterium]|nr:putative sporulation protein YtxC [Clostridia bacterium]